MLPDKTKTSSNSIRNRKYLLAIIISIIVIVTSVTIPVVLVKKRTTSSPSPTTTASVLTTTITMTTTSTTTTISRIKPNEYNRSYLTDKTVWKQDGRTVVRVDVFSDNIDKPGMFCGLAIDENETIYVSDYTNRNIFKQSLNDDEIQMIYKNTEDSYSGGYRDFVFDQNDTIILCSSITNSIIRISIENSEAETIISETNCYGLAIDNERNIYFSNDIDHEVKKWHVDTHELSIVAGGNGRGNETNQLAHPTSIFIDEKQSLYISDFGNRRIMKVKRDSNEFHVIASDKNGLEQLESVGSIYVDHLENVYVSDWSTHRIVRCNERQIKCEIIIGGNEGGSQPNQLHYPAGITIDKYGHMYVADRLNYRVQKFEIEFY